MIDYSQIELKTMAMVETVIKFIRKYMYTRKNTCYRTAIGAVSAYTCFVVETHDRSKHEPV